MAEHLGSLPFFVRALYPFRSEEASGLTFDRGNIIEVLACLESGWWNGVCGSNRGWFPSNYVEQVSAEQVQILRQAMHLQHQKLPSIPPAPEAAAAAAASASASAPDSAAVAVSTVAEVVADHDIGLRRGSLADAQAGVASAVPSRLRTGRRPSSPHNALLPAASSEGDHGSGSAMLSVRSRSDSFDQLNGLGSSSVHTTEAVHVAQWESRLTLDGRTYFCNIFTDKTVWTLASGAESGAANGSRGVELIGDEATLVYVSLLMGRSDSVGRRDMAAAAADVPTDVHVLAGSGGAAAGAWDQMAAAIALAAFALASSVSVRAKHEYLGLLSQVVSGVKRLLLSSSPGASGADGPIFRSHRMLRDSHTAILQHVCALTLSAKVASTVWPPPDAADAVHADVAGLVRAVRAFIVDAETAGVAARPSLLEDDSVTLLPGIELDTARARTPFGTSRSVAKRLSTLQRNEHTGATVLVKGGDSPERSPHNAESLFARDRTGIRQRLRQHLAEHHQRTNGKAVVPTPAATTAVAPEVVEARHTPPSATADVLLQLDEGTHELARVILALDRYLRKIERFYADDQSPASAADVRSAADARLVAYAKHLVAALAVLLQVLDDFDAYSSAVVSAAATDDGDVPQTGPAALVLSTMDALRACRAQASDSIGLLVAATQDFADSSLRYAGAADSSAAERDDGQRDAEIPSEDALVSAPAERVLVSLVQIADALQALNHSAMALHISAKRVVEACDICDLRVLWLRVAKYHMPPNALASVPAGPPEDSGLRSATAATLPAPPRLGFRRSSSLPHLRRAAPAATATALPASGFAGASASRPRADTIDAADGLAPHLARRALASDDASAVPLAQAVRDARAKDKLNRFFGDDPSQYPQSRRPPHLDDLAITPVSSLQLGSMSRTPTRSGYPDEPVSAGGPGSAANGAGALSIMSSRSSTTPSTKAVASSNAAATTAAAASSSSPAPQDQVPWYLSYDSSPEDLLLTNDGQVKGSTLPALVERLVAHDVSDPNFVSTFLLTYHSFTMTPELFENLFRRFLILPPPGLLEHELVDWTERKLKPVRLRVYNLFKTWLEQHYVEQVEGDPLGLEMLREFACTTMAEHMSNAAEQLVRLIDKRRASQGGLRKMVPNMPHAAPGPILPRSLSRLRLLDISPQELARQFTLIDSNLFNKVRPIECLKTAWSRKPGDPKAFNGLNTEIAVNVKAMSTLSTQTTLWVTANILLEHEIKRRAAVVKFFISFAEHCRNLNNFNTLMSVLGALTSVPVERLTRTWQAVQQKSLSTYNQLKQIMRTDRNFAEYRDSLHSCNPPAIPFVGVYLQDLTFIEDGNDDVIHGSPRLINFAKRQRTAGTIRDLQQFQNVPYNLTPVAEIQDWLLKRLEELCPHGQSSDRLVEEFWKMSTTLEPKEKDSERVLRLLKESGFL
ncbi:hypothetical protein GGI20_002990 [Coemansia sp. BCRC 34301]|nr:hypothetical protein GGI20_002990 [Coemansia sp. BCRC 34301]